MRFSDRPAQVFFNRNERGGQGSPSRQDHIIVARLDGIVREQPYSFPQASSDAIALYGVSQLLRGGEAEPGRAGMRACDGLKSEGLRMHFCASGGRDKVASTFQALRSRVGAAAGVRQTSLATEERAALRPKGVCAHGRGAPR